MILSLPQSSFIKQYLPGLYFIGVALYIGIDNNSLLAAGLLLLPFLVQMLLNNKYLNLALGFVSSVWSIYMAFIMFTEPDKTIPFILMALSFTILNLYMSRMLFLNQNFNIAALRENSLDDTLFI
jgi:hypothetical protein